MRSPSERLRSLATLEATSSLEEGVVLTALADGDEHVRAWAVRRISEQSMPHSLKELQACVTKETSGFVLTYAASGLQKLPVAARWSIAKELARHGELADDRVFPLMLWYGVEGGVVSDSSNAAELLKHSKIPLLTQFIARRLATELQDRPTILNQAVEWLMSSPAPELSQHVLQGMADGTQGWQKATPPAKWSELSARIASSNSAAAKELSRDLSVLFGDGRALDDVRRIATSKEQSVPARQQAVRTLVQARAPELEKILIPLLPDRELGEEAVRHSTEAIFQGCPTALSVAESDPEHRQRPKFTPLCRRVGLADLLPPTGWPRIVL